MKWSTDNPIQNIFIVVIAALVLGVYGLWSTARHQYTGTLVAVSHHVDNRAKDQAHNTVVMMIDGHQRTFTDQVNTLFGKSALVATHAKLHTRYHITTAGFAWQSDVDQNVLKLKAVR